MAIWKKIATIDDVTSANGASSYVSGDIVNDWGGSNYSALNAAGKCYGESVKIGTAISFTGGKIYALTPTGWTLATNTTVSHGKYLLAIATGTTTSAFPNNGMLTKGVIRMDSIDGTDIRGSVLYMHTTGNATANTPTATGSIVRPIGYAADPTYNVVYFDPDKTWVELA
jgi:hypothetical protein